MAWLIAHLTAFQLQIPATEKMSAFQLEACAQTIFDSYHHLKTTEIMLFLTRLAGGMYPVEWYGAITPTKIVSALRDHFMPWRNELLHTVEQQRRERRRREESMKPGLTWSQYLASVGEPMRESPLERLLSQQESDQ